MPQVAQLIKDIQVGVIHIYIYIICILYISIWHSLFICRVCLCSVLSMYCIYVRMSIYSEHYSLLDGQAVHSSNTQAVQL